MRRNGERRHTEIGALETKIAIHLRICPDAPGLRSQPGTWTRTHRSPSHSLGWADRSQGLRPIDGTVLPNWPGTVQAGSPPGRSSLSFSAILPRGQCVDRKRSARAWCLPRLQQSPVSRSPRTTSRPHWGAAAVPETQARGVPERTRAPLELAQGGLQARVCPREVLPRAGHPAGFARCVAGSC